MTNLCRFWLKWQIWGFVDMLLWRTLILISFLWHCYGVWIPEYSKKLTIELMQVNLHLDNQDQCQCWWWLFSINIFGISKQLNLIHDLFELFIIHPTFGVHTKCNWPVLFLITSKLSMNTWSKLLNIHFEMNLFVIIMEVFATAFPVSSKYLPQYIINRNLHLWTVPQSIAWQILLRLQTL